MRRGGEDAQPPSTPLKTAQGSCRPHSTPAAIIPPTSPRQIIPGLPDTYSDAPPQMPWQVADRTPSPSLGRNRGGFGRVKPHRWKRGAATEALIQGAPGLERLQPLPGETAARFDPVRHVLQLASVEPEGCVTSCYRCDLRLPRLSRDGPRAESTLSSSPTPHPRASRPARTPALSPEGGVVACREEEEEEERLSLRSKTPAGAVAM